MPDSMGARVARLDERLNSMDRTLSGILEALKDQNSTSSAYRSAMRDEVGKLVMRTTQLEADVLSVKARIGEVQAVTDDVRTLRERALGAGTLGRVLIVVGQWIVSAAAGAAAAYTWLTGRPPP